MNTNTNTNTKSKKKIILVVVVLFCMCCCLSSIISGGSLFLKSDKKDEPAASPPSDASPPAASPPAASPPPGTPIQCNANDVGSGANAAVYRVVEGKVLRHYPNPPIASSWDPDWGTTYKKIDCLGFTQGPAMTNISNLGDKDAQCYLNRYTDLQKAFGANNTTAAKTHWNKHGKGEKRNPLC
jgi:hypothetical protein